MQSSSFARSVTPSESAQSTSFRLFKPVQSWSFAFNDDVGFSLRRAGWKSVLRMPERLLPGGETVSGCRRDNCPAEKRSPGAGETFARRKNVLRMPERLLPGGKTFSGCRRNFCPAEKRSPDAGDTFARRKNVLRMPERLLPGGKTFSGCRRDFCPVAKRSPDAGEIFPNWGNVLPLGAGWSLRRARGRTKGLPALQAGAKLELCFYVRRRLETAPSGERGDAGSVLPNCKFGRTRATQAGDCAERGHVQEQVSTCGGLSLLGKNCIFVHIMRKLFIKTGQAIQAAIDFTYPPFRRLMPQRIYRYGVCGTANVVFDWVLYFFVYHFILQYRFVHIGIVTVSPHIASLVLIFPVVTCSGFLLQKYVTFTASELRGRVQLIRYLMVILTNLLINYVGLKILVEGLDIYPTPSKMIITSVTIICSYVGQNKFTFKIASPPEEAEKSKP
jgi:putative flippase GtrA